jgi:hypothetical protein
VTNNVGHRNESLVSFERGEGLDQLRNDRSLRTTLPCSVLTSCVTIGLYAQLYHVPQIKLKSEQIHSFRHRQVLSIPKRIAVQEK